MDAIVDKTPDMPPQREVAGMMVNADLSEGPFFIDGFDTLPKLFEARCKEPMPNS